MSGAGLIATLCIILMLAAMVASAVINVLAIVKQEKTASLIRIGSLVLSAGAGFYALSVPALTGYIGALPTKFDFISLLVAIVGVAIYGWLAFRKDKKAMLKPAAQYGVTLLSTILLVAGVALAGKTANIIVVILILLACVSLVFSQLCVIANKSEASAVVDRVRFIAHLAIALIFCLVCLFTLGGKAFLFSFLGTLVAAVPVAENFLNANKDEEGAETEEYAYTEYSDSEEEDYGEGEPELEMFPSIPRPKMIPQEETADAMKGYQVEEYAEAYAYEGGPVAGVELAEEVNPTFIPSQGQVSTGGYDFYNCQSFDPFIATLNNEERNQFTELFILKYKGVMPEIPDYVVGGDNREFFRKIFIYLGQYRERIPNGLLNKIYAYSTKLS